MLFIPAFIFTCLLSSAVFASSSPYHERSGLIERQREVYDPDSAGAKFNAWHKGSVASVSAQFTIPRVGGPADSSAVVGVLLDGDDNCYSVLSGLQMSVTQGQTYYNAVWQIGGNNFNVYGPTFRAGEQVNTTIKADSSGTSFSATIMNVHSGERWDSPQFSTPTPACRQYAFWGVIKVTSSMPAFGSLDLEARANSDHKTVNAKNTEIYSIYRVAGVTVSSDGNTVSILG